jgi:hypothetical protein
MLLHAFQRSTCFLAFWLLLWGWVPAAGGPPPVAAGASRCCGRLYVIVRAEGRLKPESLPVAGVKVELRQRSSEAALTFETDRNGRGAHVGIPEGVYRVRFIHPDFTTVELPATPHAHRTKHHSPPSLPYAAHHQGRRLNP